MAGKMQTIRVEIYDQPYNLKTDSGEQYTHELAQAVDAIMRTIGDQTKSYDSVKLAVLAALHFADECQRLKERYGQLHEAVADKAVQLADALDQGLEQSRVA
jgi:cell division protein ZapA (FtsZ GTPase activity inhibitor)